MPKLQRIQSQQETTGRELSHLVPPVHNLGARSTYAFSSHPPADMSGVPVIACRICGTGTSSLSFPTYFFSAGFAAIKLDRMPPNEPSGFFMSWKSPLFSWWLLLLDMRPANAPPDEAEDFVTDFSRHEQNVVTLRFEYSLFFFLQWPQRHLQLQPPQEGSCSLVPPPAWSRLSHWFSSLARGPPSRLFQRIFYLHPKRQGLREPSCR